MFMTSSLKFQFSDVGKHLPIGPVLAKEKRRGWVVFRLRVDIHGIPLAQILQEQTDRVVGMLDHQMDVKRLLRDLCYVANIHKICISCS